MSKLLISESPLVVLPSLAVAVGLEEAIILQQLHYWLLKGTNILDGKPWVYNSYADWKSQFPFLSTQAIGRVFRKLEGLGIVRADSFNTKSSDRTKWYTIDYPALELLELSSFKNDMPNVSKVNNGDIKTEHSSLPKTTTKTTTESEPDRSMWPESYSLFYGLEGAKISHEDYQVWLDAKGIPESFALEKVYALREWWPTRPKKREDPWLTFQNWVTRDWKKEKPVAAEGVAAGWNRK